MPAHPMAQQAEFTANTYVRTGTHGTHFEVQMTLSLDGGCCGLA